MTTLKVSLTDIDVVPSAEVRLRDGLVSDDAADVFAREQVLSTLICRSWEELRKFSADWDDILQVNESLSIFSTREWLESWWQAYGKNRDLFALIVSQGEEVVGIVPLYREQVIGLHCFRLVGDGSDDSDNLDLIVRPGYEPLVSQELVRWMQRQQADLCEFNTLRPQSANLAGIKRAFSEQPVRVTITTRPSETIVFPDSWAVYLSQLSSNMRQRVQRLVRRTEKRFHVKLHKQQDSTELPQALQSLFDLHQRRWETSNEPGSFASAERRDFYGLISERFLRRGWLEFWSLELDGKVVAMEYSFRRGDVVYLLQEGYDPGYSQESVGFVLRCLVLKKLVESGVRYYDFLAGQNQSKQRWGTTTGQYVDLRIALTRKGKLFVAFQEIVNHLRRRAHACLPSRAVSVIRRTRKTFGI